METVLLNSVVLLIAGVFLLLMVRVIVRSYRLSKRIEEKGSSQVGFVVDTFHELVSRLKEKEKELENLRKSAEDRAVAIEGYNENILQSVPSGVISFDEKATVTKMNRAAEKILELEGETAVGRNIAEVLNRPITDFLREKRYVERGETSYTTPSGKRIWLGLTLSPLTDKQGSVIGQILVFTDLTHLKAIESQIELRNRLLSLGEISAGIAHELRNPMAVIAGYTKLLLKKTEAPLKPTVDAIAKEIAVMDRIITDFLSFAKPVEPDLAEIDLKQLIQNCITSVSGGRDDIGLNTELSNLPHIKGDEVLLRQAFTNLIQNSVDAMPQGGVLTISASPAPVPESDTLDIRISDTGHGISKDVRNKIFLPFFTTKERGTGLGLSIVHKIVVSHGGNISAESSEKGTSFKIKLPLSQ